MTRKIAEPTDEIPDEVLKHHSGIVGKTGSGKTVTAKGSVEKILRMDPRARVCILDPIKSDWWGLTASADGKKAGLPFMVLGGPRGHVPLSHKAGAAVAEIVANGSLPLSIVDMADFGLGGLQTFFNDFVPVLMRKMRGTLHLVLEEAHEFAPKESAGISGESMGVYHAKKLATAGRSKGIRLMVLTQRTQQLHNSLLGSCENVIIHRLRLPADRKPIESWLKGSVEKEVAEKVIAAMPTIPTGQGFLVGDEGDGRLLRFPMIRTFDNSAAPSGDAVADVVRAAVDKEFLRTILGEAVAEVEANDPAKLRAEIAALRKAANRPTAASPAPPDAQALAAARREGQEAGLAEGAASERERLRKALDLIFSKVSGLLAGVSESSAALEAAIDPSSPVPAPSGGRQVALPPKPPPKPAPPPRAPQAAPAGVGGAPMAARKMLAVLDLNPPPRRTWGQTAGMAGLKARGGSFNRSRKWLVDSGLIVEEGGFVRVANPSAGAADAAPVGPEEMVAAWEKVVGAAAARYLRFVYEAGGSVEQEALAADLGVQPRGGSWNRAWKELRDNNLVDVVRGVASLTAEFQPEGTSA